MPFRTSYGETFGYNYRQDYSHKGELARSTTLGFEPKTNTQHLDTAPLYRRDALGYKIDLPEIKELATPGSVHYSVLDL